MRREFETPAPVHLVVQLTAGRVEIEAGEGGVTSVELEPLNGSEVTARAIEEATIGERERGGRREVRVEIGKLRSFSLRTPEVGVKVACPAGSSVELMATAADVRATGQLGAVEAKNVSGDTTFTHVEGDLRLKSVSGDVYVGRAVGRAEVGTVSGDVRIEHVGGDCVVKTVSGDLTVPEALASVSATTVSGDQQLDSVAAGRIDLRSVSGDLRVGVRQGTSVWLDVNSRSGDISSGLDEDDGAGGGGAAVEIRATSVSGDIAIVRGPRQPVHDAA